MPSMECRLRRFLLESSGRHCKLPDPSFLVRCDYGAAELLLRHLYPDASPASGSSSGSGRIVGFDQTEFFDETERSTSLHEFGLSVCAGSLREQVRIWDKVPSAHCIPRL